MQKRAKILTKIRAYFDAQNVLEVQTPTLLTAPTTDVYIDSISVLTNPDINPKTQYLHTSPELEMKKLLAQGYGDIYQICQVYRDNEFGERNFNEFTLLEYYRLGFDIHQLMDDIAHLLAKLGVKDKINKLSYQQAFEQFADIDILNTDFNDLKIIARKYALNAEFDWIEDLQMMLFVHLIEPELKKLPVCFIYDYPSAQSALAKVEGQIAHRFELYLSGVEIANGYDELQDAQAYQQIFNQENDKRKQLKKPFSELDLDFLEQLKEPLAQCSGVAIGVERLTAQISSIRLK
ncbi:EF-P lysine aminoacylase EpmA [Candidatus Thioglobus sp.]|uniref:EF-P lysine aminoacylase EpmA n=1 Tax=Candidatus Thioglobus sp. TaxID=2026721 RepID=UPI003D0AFC22